MEEMRYTEALRKLFEVMEGRPDIKEIKFNRENDSFDVISDTGVHVCFGDEFRNRWNRKFIWERRNWGYNKKSSMDFRRVQRR